MKRNLLALGIFLGLAANLPAQTPNPFVGKWKVQWQAKTQMANAEMRITETGGTWQTFARSKNDGCVGIEVKIHFESISPNSLNAKLKFSEALAGCTDATISLRTNDDGTVSGQRGKVDLLLERSQ